MKKTSYEKWCAAFIQNLSAYLNLSGWQMEVLFSPQPKENCEGCYADINVDSVYMQLALTIYPMARTDFESGNLEKLTRVLTHELCHVLIDPLHNQILPFLSDTTRPFFTDTLENVTQRIALVVYKNLPKQIMPPR